MFYRHIIKGLSTAYGCATDDNIPYLLFNLYIGKQFKCGTLVFGISVVTLTSMAAFSDTGEK